MKIIVKENDVMQRLYRCASLMRYIFIVAVVIAIASILSGNVVCLLLSAVMLYIFGVVFLRPIRIESLQDDYIAVKWPKVSAVKYDSVRIVVNLSPYDYDVHHLFVVYKTGVLIMKFNFCWVPINQGILEHLKSKGVKVRNLWFWQEKD